MDQVAQSLGPVQAPSKWLDSICTYLHCWSARDPGMTKDFAIALQFLLAAEIRKASIIIHSQIKVVASQELWSTLFTYIHSAVSCFNLPLSSMFLLCWLDLQRYGEHNAQDFGHRYFNGPSMPDPLLNAFFGVNYFQLLTQRYMEASTKQEPQCPAKGGRWGSNDLDDWDLHDWTPQSLSGSATRGTAKAPAWHLRKEAVTGSLASPHGFKWVKGSEEWVVESDIRYPYRSRSKTNVKKKILVAYSCQKRVEVCWIWQHKQEHAKIVSHDGLYIYVLMWGIRLDTNRWQRCEKPKLFQGSRYRHKSNFCAGGKAPWIARKRGRTCESRADFRKAEILAIHKFGLKFLFGFGSHKCSSVAGTLQCCMLVLLCHLESGWLKRTRHGLQPGNLYLRCLLQWRYQPTDTPNHIACHASTASPASPASGSAYSSPNYTQNIMSQDMLEDELPILWATEWNTPPKAWLKADDQIEPLF